MKHSQSLSSTEPEFVNLLRSTGIDSQPGGPVRQPYLTYRLARLQCLHSGIDSLESIPGLLKRLQIRALKNVPVPRRLFFTALQ